MDGPLINYLDSKSFFNFRASIIGPPKSSYSYDNYGGYNAQEADNCADCRTSTKRVTMRKYCAMDYVFLVTVKVKPKKYFSKNFDKNLKSTTSCSKLQLRFPSTKTVAQKLVIT